MRAGFERRSMGKNPGRRSRVAIGHSNEQDSMVYFVPTGRDGRDITDVGEGLA